MKKIVVTHAFGAQNRGDHELLSKLVELLSIKFPSSQIVVYTTYPETSQGKILGVQSFIKSPFYRPKRLLQYVQLGWDMFFWILSSHFIWFRHFMSGARRSAFNDILLADSIYMCPGGYLYSNRSSYYVNLLNGYPFRRVSDKVVASPMSIGPFDSKIDFYLAKFFLNNLGEIHVRESYSKYEVERMGLRAISTPDLAWYGAADYEVEDHSWRGKFVGTLIDWRYKGHDYEVMRERYIEEYLQAANILYRESGYPLVLYNQVGLGDGSSADEKLICEVVSRSEGKIVYDRTAATPDILKKRMKSCNGVLASRFHSALFAVQARVPFVAIAYQPKATYILRDISLSHYCRSIEDFSGAEAAATLILMSNDRDVVEKELNRAAEGAVLNIEKNFLGL